MYIGIIIGLALTTLLLLVRLLTIRHSLREIVEQMKEKMSIDTNTLISVSTADSYVRALAKELNIQLAALKSERRRYQEGDAELKSAITNISHDIRTPLTAICSYLELLEETDTSDTVISDTVARYLDVIKGRTKSLTELTEELFRYSVIVTQSNEMVLSDIVINEVLEESIAEFYAAFKTRNIVPKISLTNQKIVRRANQKALSRVFSNVINNALKYSEGDLAIELNDEGEVIFSNQAPELNEVLVGKLFDRFYTVENSRKSTGLGLTIAKTLMEQMQGSIHADYSEGRLVIRIGLN